MSEAGRIATPLSADRLTREFLTEYQSSEAFRELATSVANFVAEIKRDYTGRALIELLQNAHDAHPDGSTGGCIRVILRPHEGPHGVLYVANGGDGFTDVEFNGIRKVAQSPKSLAAGIGHKGVGFRSVFQLTDFPQIYSKNPGQEQPGFGGYRFAFATPRDLARIWEGPEDVVRAVHGFPLLTDLDDADPVQEWATDPQIATVVRLPLKSSQALAEAAKQIERLRTEPHPILLFLPRIRTLLLDDGESPITQRREEGPLAGALVTDDFALRTVTLNDRDVYIVAGHLVDSDDLDAAIIEDMTEGHVSEAWTGLTEKPVWVFAAIKVDDVTSAEPSVGRCYTFLPMGPDAAAPLVGHVQAPFVVSMNRLHLQAESSVNDLFFRTIAAASARAAAGLAAIEEYSDSNAAASAGFLAWREPRLDELVSVLRESKSVPKVPVECADGTGAWVCLDKSCAWPSGLSTMDSPVAAEAGLSPIASCVPAPLVEVLADISAALELSPLKATLSERTRVAEHAALNVADAGPSSAHVFYKDLLDLFDGDELPSISSSRLLLGADGEVHPFMTPGLVQAFRSPQRDEALQFAVPPSLADRIVFAHPDIEWSEPITIVQSLGERYDHLQLVREYSREAILAALAQITTHEEHSDTVRVEALRWMFNLWKEPRPRLRTQVSVPNGRGGWTAARGAVFGPTWGDKRACMLADLIALNVDEELNQITGSFIELGEEWSDLDKPALMDFLEAAGVRHGIQPIRHPAQRRTAPGEHIEYILGREVLPDQDIGWWRKAHDHSLGPRTDYQLAPSYLWRLPGQHASGDWPDTARILYAQLIAGSVAGWDKAVFECDLIYVTYGTTTSISSPLHAFLQHAPWVPTPHEEDGTRFREVSRSWYWHPTYQLPEPRYLPQIDLGMRRSLDLMPTARTRLGEAGLLIYGEKASDPHLLTTIGELVADGSYRNARELRRAYNEVWRRLDGDDTNPLGTNDLLVVRVGQELRAIPLDDEEPNDIVIDDAGGLTSDLISLTSLQVLAYRPRNGAAASAVARWIEKVGTVRASLSSDLSIGIELDGREVNGELECPAVSTIAPWLVDWVVLTLELDVARTGALDVPESTLRRSRDAIARARVLVGKDLSMIVDSNRVPLPTDARGSVLWTGDKGPIIATTQIDSAPTLRDLGRLAEPLAEVIELTPAAPHLKASISELILQLGYDELPEEVDATTWAAVYNVEPSTIDEILREGLRDEQDVLRLARVLLQSMGGAAQDDLDLSDALSKAAELTGQSPGDVADLVRSCRTLRDLYEQFDLNLGMFNGAVADEYGPEHQLTFPSEHSAAMAAFANRNRSSLLARLRARYMTTFDEHADLNDYVDARELEIDPDPEWLPRFRTVPDELLSQQAALFVGQQGASELELEGEHSDVDELRAANVQAVRTAHEHLATLIEAWTEQSSAVEEFEFPGARDLAERLDSAGQLDFRPLGRRDVAVRLQLIGTWPTGMTASDDPADFGMTSEQWQHALDRFREKLQEQELDKSTVKVGNERYGTSDEEKRKLAEAIMAKVGSAILGTGKNFTKLQDASARPKRSGAGGKGGGGGGGSNPADLPEKKDLIGLIGECIAYQWLCAKYPEAGPHSWVSRNRVHGGLGLTGGNDGLGYDFLITDRTQTLYFEVKATSGFDESFDLSPNEVRFALSRASRGGYRILHITNARDPENAQLRILPNPFTKRGQQTISAKRSGMKFSYNT